MTLYSRLLLALTACGLALALVPGAARAEENVYSFNITNLAPTTIYVCNAEVQWPDALIHNWVKMSWGDQDPGTGGNDPCYSNTAIYSMRSSTTQTDNYAGFHGRSYRLRKAIHKDGLDDTHAYVEDHPSVFANAPQSFWKYNAFLYNEDVKFKVKYKCSGGSYKTFETGRLSAGAYEANRNGNQWNIAITDCNGGNVVSDENEKSLWNRAIAKRGLDGAWTDWLDSDPTGAYESISRHRNNGNLTCAQPSGVLCYNVDTSEYLGLSDEEADEETDTAYLTSCDLNAGLTGPDSHNWKVRYFCEYGKMDTKGIFTPWLDVDDPGAAGDGNHDYEKLGKHAHAGNIPSQVLGKEPSYVEMRGKSSTHDVTETGDSYVIKTFYGAKVRNYGDNPADEDYEVRFYYGFTPWLSIDNYVVYGKSSDYEPHARFTDWSSGGPLAGRMPNRDPDYVECRAKDYPDTVFSSDSPTQNGLIHGNQGDGVYRYFECSTTYGYRCMNRYNGSGCINAEVRYYFEPQSICDGNAEDGYDNGVCDGSK